MKTFENLQSEIPTINQCSSLSGQFKGLAEDRDFLITKMAMKNLPLHVRITKRGNAEQYRVRFLQNYHGDQKKRISKGYNYLSVNTKCGRLSYSSWWVKQLNKTPNNIIIVKRQAHSEKLQPQLSQFLSRENSRSLGDHNFNKK